VLLRLTQPGEGTEDNRRRAPRSELAPAEDDGAFDAVLGRLIDARLLTARRPGEALYARQNDSSPSLMMSGDSK
jgi:hypothetical protein